MRFASLILSGFVALPAVAAPEQCFHKETHGGTSVLVYIGDRKCVEFDAPREMEGVWFNVFEGSSFHEKATSLDDTKSRPRNVWLTMDEQTVRPAGFRIQHGHAYRLRMVARAAKDMNRPPLKGYGHMGGSPGLVLVEQITEWEDLGAVSRR